MQLFAALGAARRHLCIQRFSCLEGIGSTRISRVTAAHSTGTCSSLSLSWKYITSKKVPGGGRGPGLRTPCASSLLLKSLVAGMMLDQATRALDGSCSGAGLAVCSVQSCSSALACVHFMFFPYFS
ncbi:hypothetical protein VPH35_020153 [Triticum aestivum]